MILDLYKDAFEYSAKDWKTLIKLGLMCLFSILLIPIFLVAGYNYRVIDKAVHGVINGKDSQPEFDDIISMFVDGVKVVVVEIIYFIIPAIILMIFAFISTQITGTLSAVILIIGCLITFIVGVLACLMVQMGICHMAHNNGSLAKAFALSELKEVIDEIGWFKCIITYLGLIIITSFIFFVVTEIIGMIFVAFGFSGLLVLGVDAGVIFVLGALVNAAVTLFIVGPYLCIFNSRSIGLLYSMQI